jgi:hypothetical protein
MACCVVLAITRFQSELRHYASRATGGHHRLWTNLVTIKKIKIRIDKDGFNKGMSSKGFISKIKYWY